MNKITKLFLRTFCISSFSIYSLTAAAFIPKFTDLPYVVTVSGNSAWEKAGHTQTLLLAPGIEKTYKAKKKTHSFAEGQVFVGVQSPISQLLLSQVGLAALTTSSAKLSGDVWDDADPQFNNHTYNYRVTHSHLALKTKLLANLDPSFIPWISVTAGLAFNRAHSFINAPTIFAALPSPNFDNHITRTFTYRLGLGFQHHLNKNLQVGLGSIC